MIRIALLLAACSVAAWGQAPVKDRVGCKDSSVLTRMPGCSIYRCDNKNYHVGEMPLKKFDRTHKVEGEYEHIEYRCPPTISPLEIIRNTEGALKNAGFTVRYSDSYHTTRYWATAQKGGLWVYAYAQSGPSLALTIVKAKEMEQVMTANADGWAKEIGQTGRVSIYGINFDTAKATVKPDSEPALKEVVKLLQANPTWAMLIAGHTDNVGAKDMNMNLSKQRAEAVIAWLSTQGIDKARLVPAGFGDGRPLADNATDDGRAKNRRVDLVKLY